MKKLLGYFFIVLSVLLTLLALLRIFSFVAIIGGLYRIVTGHASGYDVGYVFGQILVWAIYIFITYTLWKFGRRWTKQTNQEKPVIENILDMPDDYGNKDGNNHKSPR